jgi:hypothetical protein
MEPCLYNAVIEEIRDGQKAHTLMVRHPAANQFMLVAPNAIARSAVIG